MVYKYILLFTTSGWSSQPYSISFELKKVGYPGSVFGFPRFSLRPAEDDLLKADEGRLEKEAADDG